FKPELGAHHTKLCRYVRRSCVGSGFVSGECLRITPCLKERVSQSSLRFGAPGIQLERITIGSLCLLEASAAEMQVAEQNQRLGALSLGDLGVLADGDELVHGRLILGAGAELELDRKECRAEVRGVLAQYFL